MHRPDFRRLPAGLLGVLFFLILACTYAAMFMVERQSEKALAGLQKAFTACYEDIQNLRIATLATADRADLPVFDMDTMASSIERFMNLSTIQWLPQGDNPAIRLAEAWQDWRLALRFHPSPEAEGLQLIKAIRQANAHLDELKHRTTEAFDLIIFLSGVLFSLGTSGSIAFYARLRQSQLKEEFAATNLKKALESEEEIRRTIAMELHDDIAQDIAAARMLCERMHNTKASTPDLASRAVTTLGEVNQKIRRLCTELRPPALEEAGLQEAVRTLCETESDRLAQPLRFLPEGDIPRLQNQVETNLYRIIREAVVNATKHAKDGNIEVRIWVTRTEGWLETLNLEVRDSGFYQGDKAGNRGYGFGITAMQERADLIGATLLVQLNPAGSLVRIMMPLKQPGRKGKGWQGH